MLRADPPHWGPTAGRVSTQSAGNLSPSCLSQPDLKPALASSDLRDSQPRGWVERSETHHTTKTIDPGPQSRVRGDGGAEKSPGDAFDGEQARLMPDGRASLLRRLASSFRFSPAPRLHGFE